MKAIKLNLLFFVLLLCSGKYIAQNGTLLIGRWSFVDMQFKLSSSESYRSMTKEMPDQYEKLKGAYYIFNAGGSLETMQLTKDQKSIQKVKGSWKLGNESGGKLLVINDGKKEITYKAKISNEVLVLEHNDSKQIFIRTMQ